MKAKVKTKQDHSHAHFKKAGMPNGVVLKKGAWQKAREQSPSGIPKGKVGRGIDKVHTSENAINQAVLDKTGGQSWGQIAIRLGVTKQHVANKVREKFINNRQGRETLKGVLLENAIGFGSQAADKIEELNGMQSVVAAGIMTQRFIDLDKHTQNIPDTIDLEEVAATGRAIQELEGYITITPSEIPDDIITLE